MAHMYVQCVVVNWVPGMSKGLIRRLDENSVYMENKKMAAWGYPEVNVDIISGRWYIPVDNPLATWLMVKYNYPTKQLELALNYGAKV